MIQCVFQYNNRVMRWSMGKRLRLPRDQVAASLGANAARHFTLSGKTSNARFTINAYQSHEIIARRFQVICTSVPTSLGIL
jgi:hypothetical protein